MTSGTISTAWNELYTGTMRGAGAHRRTGLRTVKARTSGALCAPLERHVTEETAHCAFASLFAMLPPVAGRYAPTAETRRKLIGGTMARQQQVSENVRDSATGDERGRREKPMLSLSRSSVGFNLPDNSETPEERIERIEETLAIVGRLLPVQRRVLEMMRGERTIPPHISKRTWRRWREYTLDAIRLIVHERGGL